MVLMNINFLEWSLSHLKCSMHVAYFSYYSKAKGIHGLWKIMKMRNKYGLF